MTSRDFWVQAILALLRSGLNAYDAVIQANHATEEYFRVISRWQ